MTDTNDSNAWNRQEAQRRLQELANAVASLDEAPQPWMPHPQQPTKDHQQSNESSSSARSSWFLNYTGFLHKPGFCSQTECDEMKSYMHRLVKTQWHPPLSSSSSKNSNNNSSSNADSSIESFGTSSKQNKRHGDYFLDSSNRIHFFAEPSALLVPDQQDANGGGATTLLPEFTNNNKITALNKVGHALHLPSHMRGGEQFDGEPLEQVNGSPTNDDDDKQNPFYRYCTSGKLRSLLGQELGSSCWRDPVVPQSMYIFKQAIRGGAVQAHQDSTFLFTTPYQSCGGLWLALDDATIDNGCLWVRPMSHREPLRRQYVRNPDYFEHEYNNATASNEQHSPPPKLIMKDLQQQQQQHDNESTMSPMDLETVTPHDLLRLGWLPLECQAGDLLIFYGTLDHLSLPNTSPTAPRRTFQLHIVEGCGVTWSPSNWLQYPTKSITNITNPSVTAPQENDDANENESDTQPSPFLRLLAESP